MAPYVEVSQLTDPLEAAQLLAGVERLDPRGILRPADLVEMAAGGLCFAATHAPTRSQAVYILCVERGQAWIEACKGEGAVDWTRTLLPAIELQASELDSVAFQTPRRGLVRIAQELGYEVTGWILRKELK